MKKLLIFLIIPFLSFGQEQWFQTFGGPGNDRGNAVQQTNDGGYILVGSSNSFGAWSDNSNDVYLIKTDENGEQQWFKTFGGTSSESGNSIQQTLDGGYIITGGVSGNILLLKTDNAGNEQWSQSFGDGFTNSGRCVQQTNDGGYIITGWYGLDVVLIKTDENGVEQWTQTFSYGYNNSGNSVKQTNDGGYIIVGHKDEGPISTSDVLMIKINEDGTEDWSQIFGGNSIDNSYEVCQTQDGGYIICGETLSFSKNFNVWLIKTDQNGNEQWAQTFSGEYDISGHAVQNTSDGGYIITGWSDVESGYLEDLVPSIILLKSDENGDEQWTKNFSDTYVGFGSSVQETNDNGYIITGRGGLLESQNYDVILIKTDANGNITSTIEIPTPTSKKKLIKTTDNLGREATNKGFQLHIYDDGTVEKKYLIK